MVLLRIYEKTGEWSDSMKSLRVFCEMVTGSLVGSYLQMGLLTVEIFNHMFGPLQVELYVLDLTILFLCVVDLGPLSLGVIGKEDSEGRIDLQVLVLWALGFQPTKLTVFADHFE